MSRDAWMRRIVFGVRTSSSGRPRDADSDTCAESRAAVLAYAAYARWTLRLSGEVESEEELKPLIMLAILTLQIRRRFSGCAIVLWATL